MESADAIPSADVQTHQHQEMPQEPRPHNTDTPKKHQYGVVRPAGMSVKSIQVKKPHRTTWPPLKSFYVFG